MSPWIALHADALVFVVWVATSAIGVSLAVWVEHTERSREEMRILRAVVNGYYAKEAEFAEALRISEAQLSRIWAGSESLNFLRCADLPVDFRKRWDAARAEARGARLYEADDLTFFRGLALASKKSMAKMSARPVLQKETA